MNSQQLKIPQMRSLVNGIESEIISISDRGLQFGDGLFETIRIHQGKPVWWQQHMDRLLEGCRRLHFASLPDIKILRKEADLLLQDFSTGTMKIIITRGNSSSGYAAEAGLMPNRVVTVKPGRRHQPKSGQGVVMGVCAQRINGSSQLSGIKHLNRLEQVLARTQCQAEGWDECIMMDNEDKVVECSMSNLFVWQQGRLLTPQLGQSGIKGICRDKIISLAAVNGIEVEQCDLELQDMLNSDGLFVSNSLIGIWPVARFVDRTFKTETNTGMLQSQLEAGICSAG